MLRLIILAAFGVGLAIAAPQFLTFKDGNIGVNFGGYSAQAGLGGLLTGNAAHGGLSASAGTPWGANAGAGLGGSVNGDSAGTAYAGAKLNDLVGASSVIAGSTTGEQQKFGFAGAESHANGNAVIKTIVGAQESPSLPTNTQQQQQQIPSSPATATKTITKHVLFTKDDPNAGNVQKIKPPKKYAPETNASISVEQKTTLAPAEKVLTFAVNSGIKSDASASQRTEGPGPIQKEPVFVNYHQRKHRLHPAGRRRLHLHKQFLFLSPTQQHQPEHWAGGNVSHQTHVIKAVGEKSPPSQAAAPQAPQESEYEHKRKSIQFNSGILTSAFNIPIGILSSIRDNLQPISVQKEITYSKST